MELDLAHGFYAQGNRIAGTYVLEHVNKKTPTMRNQVSLLEEYYGFRDWQKFREGLDDAIALETKEIQSGPAMRGRGKSETSEIEKILRRLTVQLDGESTTAAEQGRGLQELGYVLSIAFPERNRTRENARRMARRRNKLRCENQSTSKMDRRRKERQPSRATSEERVGPKKSYW